MGLPTEGDPLALSRFVEIAVVAGAPVGDFCSSGVWPQVYFLAPQWHKGALLG